MQIYTVNEATQILKDKGLVKNIEGTRRYIRKGEIIADKISNHEGYRIHKQHLEVFIWAKENSLKDIINRILVSEKLL